jgi:anthranilate phosphoribosyltransferase
VDRIASAVVELKDKKDLSRDVTRAVFEEIMTGKARHAEIVEFLKALRDKGETVDEITGAAMVMREKAVKIDPRADPDEALLDTCGTGGTQRGEFNVSTAVAFVAAACGVKVAKHGNRSASGRVGSADVLASLGVKIDADPALTERCIREIGVGFMFAPLYHVAMKYAAAPRKEIGTRTIFNILGPLSNPANTDRHVMGVFSPAMIETMAKVLGNLGSKRAAIVHSYDGLDEVTLTEKTMVVEWCEGRLKKYDVAPEDFGLERCAKEDIAGGSSADNAGMIVDILAGKKGPARDTVVANTALALIVCGKAGSLRQCVKTAEEAIDSLEARKKLEDLIKMTNGQK